jgi:hypothetical protein
MGWLHVGGAACLGPVFGVKLPGLLGFAPWVSQLHGPSTYLSLVRDSSGTMTAGVENNVSCLTPFFSRHRCL